jgi:hypothetical protein
MILLLKKMLSGCTNVQKFADRADIRFEQPVADIIPAIYRNWIKNDSMHDVRNYLTQVRLLQPTRTDPKVDTRSTDRLNTYVDQHI